MVTTPTVSGLTVQDQYSLPEGDTAAQGINKDFQAALKSMSPSLVVASNSECKPSPLSVQMVVRNVIKINDNITDINIERKKRPDKNVLDNANVHKLYEIIPFILQLRELAPGSILSAHVVRSAQTTLANALELAKTPYEQTLLGGLLDLRSIKGRDLSDVMNLLQPDIQEAQYSLSQVKTCQP